jgi:DNA processing protein
LIPFEHMFAADTTMPNTRETAAVVALLRRGDRLWHHYADLIESRGSAVAVLQGDYEDPTQLEEPALFDTGPAVSRDVDLEPVIREVEEWQAEGMQVLTVLDDDYPANLRTIHNRPPLLFVRGKLTPSDDESIAIVGTRKPSAEGLHTAAEMAAGITDAGYTVVSGLAEGIDTAAHQATLDRGGRTIAVIGTGLRRFYPAKNADLQRRLVTESAVISQFWPDAPPTRRSFPMRNVVMSGFALATVVVEAGDTSGARTQARHALGHGRPVFLFASLLEHEWARRYAEMPGTHVVETADQVLDRIGQLTSVDALSV